MKILRFLFSRIVIVGLMIAIQFGVFLFFLIKFIKIMIIFTASSSECLSLKLVQAASFLIQRPAVQPFHLSAVL